MSAVSCRFLQVTYGDIDKKVHTEVFFVIKKKLTVDLTAGGGFEVKFKNALLAVCLWSNFKSGGLPQARLSCDSYANKQSRLKSSHTSWTIKCATSATAFIVADATPRTSAGTSTASATIASTAGRPSTPPRALRTTVASSKKMGIGLGLSTSFHLSHE